MKIAPLSDVLGAEISGVDIARDLDGEAFAAVLDAFHRYRVLAFREQYLNPADQVGFAARFGPLEVHDNRRYNLPDHEHVMVLSNDLRDGEPIGVPDAGDSWHTDLAPRGANYLKTRSFSLPTELQPDGIVIFCFPGCNRSRENEIAQTHPHRRANRGARAAQGVLRYP